MRKRVICEKELRELYIEKKLPNHKIAEAFHISTPILKRYLLSYKIPLRPKGFLRKKEFPPDDVLKKLYLEERLSSNKIARLYGFIGNTEVCKALRRLGITRPAKGPNSRHRKPNPIKYSRGYHLTYAPNHPRAQKTGYVFDHVLAIEKKLGFVPSPSANIHHIDFDKTNNDPENLLLCGGRQHRLYHNEIADLVKALFSRGIVKFSIEKGYYLSETQVLNS